MCVLVTLSRPFGSPVLELLLLWGHAVMVQRRGGAAGLCDVIMRCGPSLRLALSMMISSGHEHDLTSMASRCRADVDGDWRAQILYDGTDTDVIAHLRAVLCVTLFFVGPPFASALEVQEMWAFTQMHVQWGGCGLRRNNSLPVCTSAACTRSTMLSHARHLLALSRRGSGKMQHTAEEVGRRSYCGARPLVEPRVSFHECRQPGNYKLMVKQGFGVERALRAGLQQGLQWLIHADPDELLYSQTESFNIATGTSLPRLFDNTASSHGFAQQCT